MVNDGFCSRCQCWYSIEYRHEHYPINAERREGMRTDVLAMAERADFDERDEDGSYPARYAHWKECWEFANELESRG